MITTKQKCYLKSLANTLTPILQVGKDGLTEDLILAILNYLNKHELMKITILKNSDVTLPMMEAAFKVCDVTIVQMVGKNVTLYKASENAVNPIRLPEPSKKTKKSR